MPLYEFHCQECGAEFGSLLNEKDTAPQCPKCGSSKTEKRMSAFGSFFRKGKNFLNQCSISS
ncbi:MAG: zinc ribbon domain-containing protein [bacterium]